jgi:hypothetical protein
VGADGIDGAPGPSLLVKGTLPDVGQLPSDSNPVGVAYWIGGVLYAWDGVTWVPSNDLQGPQGIQGDVGPAGADGPAGAAGEPGPSLKVLGTQPDIGSLPGDAAAGDAYWVGTQLYAYNGTSWEASNSLQGPQGEQGIQGIQGLPGVDGAVGPGITVLGSFGTEGELPPTATLGDAYWVGGSLFIWNDLEWVGSPDLTGPQGPQGLKGDTGLQGDPGVNGTNGNNLTIKGTVGSAEELPPAGEVADAYWVGTVLYAWDGSIWVPSNDLQGPQGEQGIQGEVGAEGPNGISIKVLGTLASVDLLPEINSFNDSYWVDGVLYTWDGSTWIAGSDLMGPEGKSAYDVVKENDPGVQTYDDFLAAIQGPVGPEGQAGVQGVAGPQGEQGVQGPQGDIGPGVQILGKLNNTGELPGTGNLGDGYLIDGNFWGWTGTAFEDLGPIQGPQGATGLQGPAGLQGAAGPQGPRGEKGDQGSLWIVLSREPTSADGRVGDYYLNSVTQQYFRKTNTTTWAQLGYLGGGNVYDSPDDGKKYVRVFGAWVELPVSSDAPIDDAYYVRQNGEWKAFNRYTLKVAATTDALDLNEQQTFTVNASSAGTINLSFVNVPGAGRSMVVVVSVTGSTATINWPAGVNWDGGTGPVLGTTKTVVIMYWDGTSWTGLVGPKY